MRGAVEAVAPAQGVLHRATFTLGVISLILNFASAIERASLLIEHPRYKGRYSDACKHGITIPKDAISFRGRKRKYIPGLSSAWSPWSKARILWRDEGGWKYDATRVRSFFVWGKG